MKQLRIILFSCSPILKHFKHRAVNAFGGQPCDTCEEGIYINELSRGMAWPLHPGDCSQEIPFCSRGSALTSFCPRCFEVMCNTLILGIIFSIHLQLWSESLWELKVKQVKFWLEDAADFLHELWNRHSKVTPVTSWHSCLLLMPLNWEYQEAAEVWTNQLCPATGRLKPVCSAAALFGAQHSQYGVSAVLPNWSVTVWVTVTWWLYCFCLHLMCVTFFQFFKMEVSTCQ